MSYTSIYVSSTDIKILFSNLIHGKNTLKTLQNNCYTSGNSNFLEVWDFKVYKVLSSTQFHLMLPTVLTNRAEVITSYLFGRKKRVWEDSMICPMLHNELWNHLLVQMLLSPTLSYLFHSHQELSSPKFPHPQPWESDPLTLHGSGHILVGSIKEKERALW